LRFRHPVARLDRLQGDNGGLRLDLAEVGRRLVEEDLEQPVVALLVDLEE